MQGEFRLCRATPLAEQVDGADRQLQALAPEIEADRDQCAEMHGNIEQQPLIGGAEHDRCQHQMGAGADRQKFRDALNQSEDCDMPEGHRL